MPARSELCHALLATAAATILCAMPQPASAMALDEYDRLTRDNKARFVEHLIRGSEKILRQQGKAEAADRLVSAFDVRQPGKSMSAGMEKFGDRLLAGYDYQRRTGKTLEVEQVMYLAFRDVGVEMEPSAFMSLGKTFKTS